MRTCDDTRQQLDRRKPNGKETAERSSSEDKGTLIEIEGEHATDAEKTDRQLLDGKEIRTGTQMLATHIICALQLLPILWAIISKCVPTHIFWKKISELSELH